MGEATHYSNWWYGVALVTILEVVGWISLYIVLRTELIFDSEFIVLLLVPALFVLAAFILTPFLVVCLYLDSKKIRASDASWEPNQYLWAGAGLLNLVSLAVVSFSIGIPIALIYLFQRYRHVGLSLFPPQVTDDESFRNRLRRLFDTGREIQGDRSRHHGLWHRNVSVASTCVTTLALMPFMLLLYWPLEGLVSENIAGIIIVAILALPGYVLYHVFVGMINQQEG